MSKETLIAEATESLKKLPESRVILVRDYIDFLLQKSEDEISNKNVHRLNALSAVFDYLEAEEDLYTLEDLKVRYSN